MVIYFRFDHTRLGNNNIDLGWLLATRTKQRWMTRLVTSFVTFIFLSHHGHDPPTKFGSHRGHGRRFWVFALVATTLSLGSVGDQAFR